jgi:outer membrane protein OmpA-like peptidoglycan-associated protein
MSGDGMKHGTGRSAWRPIGGALALVLGFALAGCSSVNPINWYRDATGISANDPKPDAPYGAALEKGAEKSYPNLASVPPPPTQALSTAERESLTQQLVADRANARYIDEQLRAGPGPSAPPPGAAPPPPPLGQKAEAAGAPAAEEPASTAQTSPAVETPPAAAPIPAVQRAKALPPPTPQVAAPAPSQAAASPPPAAAPPPTRSSIVSLNAPDPGHSPSTAEQPSQSPEPAAAPAAPPMVSPSVRSVPQPETPRAPPPPPSLAGTQPARAPSAPVPPRVASLAPTAAPEPGTTLGHVSFAPNSTQLSPAGRQAVQAAAQKQRQSGSPLRVVGHGGTSGDSPTQQLASFRIALDRATAVASALTQAGVPTDRILLETAPAGAGAPNQAEIFLGN